MEGIICLKNFITVSMATEAARSQLGELGVSFVSSKSKFIEHHGVESGKVYQGTHA